MGGRGSKSGFEKNKNWEGTTSFPHNYANPDKFKDWDLPDLSGSEKQIAWANEIRSQAVADLETAVRGYMRENVVADYLKGKSLLPTYKLASWHLVDNFVNYAGANRLDGMNDHTRAAYWIDNRKFLTSLGSTFGGRSGADYFISQLFDDLDVPEIYDWEQKIWNLKKSRK